MDKEQAIETLRANYPDACYEQLREAVDAAIEALKAQLSQQGTTSDMISRQAAIDAVDKYDFNIPEYMEGFVTKLRDAMKEDLREDIAGLPPAQPEPHGGYWIRRDCGLDVECKCSKCGYRDFVEPRDGYWFKRNFCPNCGARMKGERQK